MSLRAADQAEYDNLVTIRDAIRAEQTHRHLTHTRANPAWRDLSDADLGTSERLVIAKIEAVLRPYDEGRR